MQEFRYLFRQFLPHIQDIQLAGLKEFPEMVPIVENGITFHQNARKKALLTAEHTGLLSLADDSGLEVDVLERAPGIHSARYASEQATDEENIQKLLAEMKDIPSYRRTAQFVCVIAVAIPGDVLGLFEGVTHGEIGFEPKGTGSDAFQWASKINDQEFIDLALKLRPTAMLESAAKKFNACGAGAAAAAVAVAKKLGKPHGILLAHTSSNEVMVAKMATTSSDSVGYAAMIF